MLDSSKSQSVDLIRVDYPTYQGALNRVRTVHQRGLRKAKPPSLLITGISGAGKSTIVEDYVRQHPPQQLEDRTVVPVLAAEIPKHPSGNAMSTMLLRALGDQFWRSGNEADKTERVIHLCNDCRVEIVLLDEFQHVWEYKAGRDDGAGWLKTAINRIRKPFVLFGMPNCVEIFKGRQQSQLRKRFSSQFYLDRFGYRDITLLGVVKKFDEELGLPVPLPLTQDRLLDRFYFASAGLIGYIAKIFDGAYDLVLERDLNGVTLQLLAEAFDETVWKNAPPELNPFHPKFAFRPLNRVGEPFEGTEF